jgi:hypothetical protein
MAREFTACESARDAYFRKMARKFNAGKISVKKAALARR